MPTTTCRECDHGKASCSTCGGYSGWPNPPSNIALGPCSRCIEGIGEAKELPPLALTHDAPTVDPEAPTEVLSLDDVADESIAPHVVGPDGRTPQQVARDDAARLALLLDLGDASGPPGPRDPSLLDSAARYHASGATATGGRSYLSYQGEILDTLRQLGGIDAEIARQCAESMLAAVRHRLTEERIKRGVE